MANFIFIGTGGFLSANARDLFTLWIMSRFGAVFPSGTPFVISLDHCFFNSRPSTLNSCMVYRKCPAGNVIVTNVVCILGVVVGLILGSRIS